MVKKQKEINQKLIPEINIGLVGHVDHGKTTLTEALTGKWTDTHSEELKRGVTIKLGYADVTFYKCKKCKSYGTIKKCASCFSSCKILRTVSFVDAPGHETLMATVLAGAAIMDGAILVIAANEPCPQPQTSEHLTALDIAGIKNLVVIQNKIDLVSKEEALKNYEQIKNFLQDTIAANAPIIPVSAQQRINLDVVIEAIEKNIHTPKRDLKKPTKMLIARSFDVNLPGTEIKNLKGGVLGGSLINGKLKVGQEVEIRPGVKIKDKFEPIRTKIVGLQKARTNLKTATAGGLLGVLTTFDPYLTKADSLSGSILGLPNCLPKILNEITLKMNVLKRVVGSKAQLKVEPIKNGSVLMLTAGTARSVGVVTKTNGKTQLKLKLPICVEKGDRVAISRQILGRWRLIGWGEIL